MWLLCCGPCFMLPMQRYKIIWISDGIAEIIYARVLKQPQTHAVVHYQPRQPGGSWLPAGRPTRHLAGYALWSLHYRHLVATVYGFGVPFQRRVARVHTGKGKAFYLGEFETVRVGRHIFYIKEQIISFCKKCDFVGVCAWRLRLYHKKNVSL